MRARGSIASMPLPLLPLLAATVVGTAAALAAQRARRRTEHATFLSAMRAGLLLDQLRSGITTPIAGASDGSVVRVSGRVESVEDTLEAPLSGRPVVAWELSAWQSIGGKAFRCVGRWSRAVPFGVVDATGRAVVTVEHARSYAAVDREERWAAWTDAPTAVRVRLVQAGVEEPTAGPLHLKESVLSEGETVVVVGKVARSSGHYRESASESVRLDAPPGTPLIFSDTPEAIEAERS